jgi:hypothetical protein
MIYKYLYFIFYLCEISTDKSVLNNIVIDFHGC